MWAAICKPSRRNPMKIFVGNTEFSLVGFIVTLIGYAVMGAILAAGIIAWLGMVT